MVAPSRQQRRRGRPPEEVAAGGVSPRRATGAPQPSARRLRATSTSTSCETPPLPSHSRTLDAPSQHQPAPGCSAPVA
eukprot:7084498-Prymnesium_polylepis.1